MRYGFLFLSFLLWGGKPLKGIKEESQLRKYLLANYSMALPVESYDSPLLISFRLVLYGIIELVSIACAIFRLLLQVCK